MPRYVVLQHSTADGVHFDFMLEAGSTLKTWSLDEQPSLGAEIDCRCLPDHRLAYLDYEGPVSGNRGIVARWDHGTYEAVCQTDDRWIVVIAGERFRGQATLVRKAGDTQRWRITFAVAADER
ncbi:MAG: hypothetical protein LLG00_16390 [Planctomycetaceae bacterium]|nr:hypothetical protein [Planctomycetaceae bacterium]